MDDYDLLNKLIADYEWLLYGGQIIVDDYNKHIIDRQQTHKDITPKLKDEIIKQIFNEYELKEFYVICVAITNLDNYIYYLGKDDELDAKLFLNCYILEKEYLNDCCIENYTRYIYIFKRIKNIGLYCINQLKKYICNPEAFKLSCQI